MTTYEFIDAICDSVIPILLLIAIGIGISAVSKKEFRKATSLFLMLFIGLIIVYGIKFLDDQFTLWPSIGADYSTHTAFALAVCVAIYAGLKSAKWIVGVFLLYVFAMLYQQYHSLLDIITTLIAVSIPLLLTAVITGINLKPDHSGEQIRG